MFARSTTFALQHKDQCRQNAARVAQDYEHKLSEQPGYLSSAFYLTDKDELVIFSTWESREEAEAVTPAVRDKFVGVLRECSLVRSPPHTEIGELVAFDVSGLPEPART